MDLVEMAPKSTPLYSIPEMEYHNRIQFTTIHRTPPILPGAVLTLCMGESQRILLLLYFDLQPGKKCHSKVMHRKEVTHSDGSYERKSRGQKLADEMGRGKKIPMVQP